MWIILLEVQYLYLYASLSLLAIKVNGLEAFRVRLSRSTKLKQKGGESSAFPRLSAPSFIICTYAYLRMYLLHLFSPILSMTLS
jgi:hypothetical protein